MQFNGEFWYKTILNTMSISYLVTLSWFSFRGTAPHIAHVIRRSRNHRKKKKCRWFFHTSKISRKRPQSSTIKRPASQFGVCKWGYAFHRNHKIMKASSATMVEPCFVSVTEKEHTFTGENGDVYKGEWKWNKKHGHGVYTHVNGEMWVMLSLSHSLVYFPVLVKNCKVDIEQLLWLWNDR